MRIIYFANNWLGWQLLEWLRSRGDDIVGLVAHPEHKRKYGEEIMRAAGLPKENIFDGSELKESQTLEAIKRLAPDIGVSILFDYIIKPDLLGLFPEGFINLHPSFLPFNRGQYPNVWSIIEGTPAGVTIHYIDKGIDTGEIIAQRQVQVEASDTGKSLYRRLEKVSVSLFKETWPKIITGEASRHPQIEGAGTYHLAADVEAIDKIDLDRQYRAGDLIDILRARTFAPHKGAYFEVDGRKIFLSLSLESERTSE